MIFGGKGKGSGANAQFIIAEGRRVKNLKVPRAATKPLPAAAEPMHKGREVMGAAGKLTKRVK